jgi:hypothetical protein
VQSQKLPPSQDSSPQAGRLLRPQEALAWLTASGLYTVFAVCKIVDKLLRHQLPGINYFVTPIVLFFALRAWRRVQRGEKVGDPLVALDALPGRFLKTFFFIFIHLFFIGSVAMMVIVAQSARFSAWMQFSVLCMFGANIIVGTLLGQHWRRKLKGM